MLGGVTAYPARIRPTRIQFVIASSSAPAALHKSAISLVPRPVGLALAGTDRDASDLGQQIRVTACDLAQLLDSGSVLLGRLEPAAGEPPCHARDIAA